MRAETTNSTVTAQDPKYGVSVEADSEVKITLTKKEAAEEPGGGAEENNAIGKSIDTLSFLYNNQ